MMTHGFDKGHLNLPLVGIATCGKTPHRARRP